MLQALSQMLGCEAGLLADLGSTRRQTSGRLIETVASPEVRAPTKGMIATRANHA